MEIVSFICGYLQTKAYTAKDGGNPAKSVVDVAHASACGVEQEATSPQKGDVTLIRRYTVYG